MMIWGGRVDIFKNVIFFLPNRIMSREYYVKILKQIRKKRVLILRRVIDTDQLSPVSQIFTTIILRLRFPINVASISFWTLVRC